MSVESQNARKDDTVEAEVEDPDEIDRNATPSEAYVFLKEDFSSVSSTSDLPTDYSSQVYIIQDIIQTKDVNLFKDNIVMK